MQGIPKSAVANESQIFGSKYTADQVSIDAFDISMSTRV